MSLNFYNGYIFSLVSDFTNIIIIVVASHYIINENVLYNIYEEISIINFHKFPFTSYNIQLLYHIMKIEKLNRSNCFPIAVCSLFITGILKLPSRY